MLYLAMQLHNNVDVLKWLRFRSVLIRKLQTSDCAKAAKRVRFLVEIRE